MAQDIPPSSVSASPIPGIGDTVPASALRGRQGRGQRETKIDLDLKNLPLSEAIDEIARKGGVKIGYAETLLRNAPNVTFRASSITVYDALTRVLDGTPFTVGVYGGQYAIVARTRQVDSTVETGALVGRVTDSLTDDGVGQVSVTILGTKFTALTNAKGEFTIPGIPVGKWSVTFKILGYASVTRTIQIEAKRRTMLRVTLRQSVSMLSGVVTTATGVQRKIELGNSIATINVDSVLQVAPVASLTDLLATRVPGMTVQRSSGQPGAPSRIRIRGASSIYGSNDPIVIVDGIRVNSTYQGGLATRDNATSGNVTYDYSAPSAFDQIDVNSIATIDVFKGPSAAALYGSDAANGVIVITTKRGHAGPARWTVSVDGGISYMPGKYPTKYFRFGKIDGFFPVGYGACKFDNVYCKVDSVVPYQALNDPETTPLGRGWSGGTSVSVSGGSQILTYALTASTSRETGVLKMPSSVIEQYTRRYGAAPPKWMRRPDQYSTWGTKSSISMEVSPSLRVGLNGSLFNSDRRQTALGLGAISTIGRLFRGDSISKQYNHFYERSIIRSLRSTNTASVSWYATPWLPITADVGIDIDTRDDNTLLPRGIENKSSAQVDTLGKFASGKQTVMTRSFNANSRVFMWDNRVSVIGGLNYVNNAIVSSRASTNQLQPGVSIPTSGFDNASMQSSGRTTFGWFVEPRLNMLSDLFIRPGFRLDNNGLAGSQAKLLGLPKLQFSWIASNAPFFPWKSVVDLLQLRIAIGSAGKQPGPADRLPLFALDTAVSRPVIYQGGAQIRSFGNTKLRPERSNEIESGFALELLQGRIQLDVTGSRKMSYDVIAALPLAYSVSTDGREGSIQANIGTVRNVGWELQLNTRPLESTILNWYVGMRYDTKSNKITRLITEQSPGGADAFFALRYKEGYPIGGVWDRPLLGYRDMNGNGFIEENEILVGDSSVYLGQSVPQSTFAMNHDVILFNGRFGMHVVMSHTGGLTQFDQVDAFSYSAGGSAANAATAPLDVQAIAVGNRTGLSRSGSFQEVSSWRVESMSINWNVSKHIAGYFGMRTMAVSLQGQNLWLKTSYSGKDPDVNSTPPNGNALLDNGAISRPRQWKLRVSLGN